MRHCGACVHCLAVWFAETNGGTKALAAMECPSPVQVPGGVKQRIIQACEDALRERNIGDVLCQKWEGNEAQFKQAPTLHRMLCDDNGVKCQSLANHVF
jgi:hypothetical protein